MNEIIARHNACAGEMVRVANEVEEGRVVKVNVVAMPGTWANIVGSMDRVVLTNSGKNFFSLNFLSYYFYYFYYFY